MLLPFGFVFQMKELSALAVVHLVSYYHEALTFLREYNLTYLKIIGGSRQDNQLISKI